MSSYLIDFQSRAMGHVAGDTVQRLKGAERFPSWAPPCREREAEAGLGD